MEPTSTVPVKASPPASTGHRRLWAYVVLVAHLVFIAGLFVPAAWQGSHYSITSHSISDMYAVGAPGGTLLAVVIMLCGVTALLFTFLSLWPSLRPAGWPAVVGSILLALSVFGLGNLLSLFEREGCRLADPGCSASDQMANAGGQLDGTLTSIGVLLLVVAYFFLAVAMKRVAAWRSLAWPTRWVAIAVVVFTLGNIIWSPGTAPYGLAERLLAATMAVGAIMFATRVLRRS